MQACGDQSGQTIEHFDLQRLAGVQVGEGGATNQRRVFLVSGREVDHVGLQVQLGLHFLDFDFVLTDTEVAGDLVNLTVSQLPGCEGHVGEGLPPSGSLDERAEASEGSLLVGTLSGNKLLDATVFVLATKRRQCLAAVHVERPHRHAPQPTKTVQEVRHGLRGIKVLHHKPSLGVKVRSGFGGLFGKGIGAAIDVDNSKERHYRYGHDAQKSKQTGVRLVCLSCNVSGGFNILSNFHVPYGSVIM
mmetsp:Transcript_61762/g.108525  ORF Transcript_61762/g.108525 Transcript_61762/m.108525 type:complete len:246 (-) Transcript_61762:97-834(-)